MEYNHYTVNIVETAADREAVRKIRKEVFQFELGETKRENEDGIDHCAIHIVAKERGVPVGCMRLHIINMADGGTIAWEKLAIKKAGRGGENLFNMMADFADRLTRSKGCCRAIGTVNRPGLLKRWKDRGFSRTDEDPILYGDKKYYPIERMKNVPVPERVSASRATQNEPLLYGLGGSARDKVQRGNNGQDRYDEENMGKLYRDVWGPDIHFAIWLTQDCSFDEAICHAKRHIASIFQLTPNHHVLEVGSGFGGTARLMARESGCLVTATNVSNLHLAESTRLAEMQGLTHRIKTVWADYHDLPFEDQVFTEYLSQEGMNHARNKDQVVAEARRVLMPGGRFVLSEQTSDISLLNGDERARVGERHGSMDLFSACDFQQLLTDHRFAMVRVDDLSNHLERVFRTLVQRIDDNYDRLIDHIPKELVDANRDNWLTGAELSERGALGWHVLVAQRPY